MRAPAQTREKADEQLLTALTTEHFTLATARSTAVSESSARSSLYLLSVSSALVALGFVSQIAAHDRLFEIFALTVLPTLFVLGVFTFLRLSESSIEDFRYGQAINRIRHYYLELAADQARYFLLSGNDDRAGVWANMGLSRSPSRWHSFFTMPMAMAFINSVIGASAVALAIGAASAAPLGLSVASGGAVAVLSIALHQRYNETAFIRATSEPAIFPSR